jgi:hypothetical protein
MENKDEIIIGGTGCDSGSNTFVIGDGNVEDIFTEDVLSEDLIILLNNEIHRNEL